MWGCVYRLVCNGHICCKPTIYLWTRYEKSFDKSVIFFLTLKKTFLPTAWHNSCWCWKESVTTESVLQDVLFTRCRKCSCPLSHSGSLINQSIGVPLRCRLQCLKSIWVDYQLYHYICFYIFMVTRGHILMTYVIPGPDWSCEAAAMFSPILRNVPTAWTDRLAPLFVQTFLVPRWCTLWLQWFTMAINFGTDCMDIVSDVTHRFLKSCWCRCGSSGHFHQGGTAYLPAN